MKNPKHKLIAILSFLILLVSSVVTFYNLYYDHQVNERRLSEAYDQVHRTYSETINDAITFYHSRAEANLRSLGTMEAFRERNHDKLYELIRPRWEVMQRENPWLVVMQFHNADGTSLLRLHQPEVYGDHIASQRAMVAYAHKSQQSVSGFEEGRQGLAFRILIPVFDHGVYIGAVEFGIATPYFTDKIRRFAGYESFFFVNQEALGKFGRIAQSIEVGQYVGMDISLVHRPLIQHYASIYHNIQSGVITHEGHSYEVNTLTITNFVAKPVGAIMFFRASTDFDLHVRHMMIASVLIVLGLIVVMVVIVDQIYTYITRKMSFQERYSQMILDSVPSPVIVTDGASLVAANSAFLGYFRYPNVESFKRDHECVCEYFEPGDTDEYLMPMHDDERWTEYMLSHPLKSHKAKITIDGVITIYEVRISVLKVSDDVRYVVIFNDISSMQTQTMTDPLTGIPNRLHFSMVFQHTIHVAQRSGKNLSVVFFDIDHFKEVNDHYGHLAGDTVLREIAALVAQRIRRSDIIARWGGEEFVILLPETDLDEAVSLAEMMRHSISEKQFEQIGVLTCSFGVAILEEGEDGEHLLNRADQMLYTAKNSGRNKVVY